MVRWKRGGRSENLEDRRASSPSGGGFGGLGRGGLPFPLPRGRGGKGGLGLMVVVVFGVVATQCLGGGGGGGGSGGSGGFDISDVLNQFPGATPQAAPDQDITEDGPDPEADQVDFVSFVLDDVQQTSATTGSSPRPVRA